MPFFSSILLYLANASALFEGGVQDLSLEEKNYFGCHSREQNLG